MARPRIPDTLTMTHLKYGPGVTEAEKDRVALALRDAGRRSEALLLYDRRPDHPALRGDLQWAIDQGAAFTVFSLRRMGVPVDDQQVRGCAVRAEEKGRWYDAHRCYEYLKDESALARVRERLPGFQVAVPANKPPA